MNNENNFQNMNNNNVQSTPQVPVQQPQPMVQQTVQQPVQPVQTVVAPVQTAPVQQEVNQIPGPANAETIDANIPGPSAEEFVMPEANTEQVVLETAPKKSGSNFILIIVALLLVIAVVYIDEIIEFVEENIISTNPSDVSDSNGDNLVGGYILLTDSTTNIKVGSIKFYNFKKNSNNFEVTLNYESENAFKDVSKENIYIEFYNSNKDVLYKTQFNVTEGIEKNIVRTYSVSLDSDVLEKSMYALVKIYSKAELEKTSKLSCKYINKGTGYSETYKHVFNFKNDILYSYTVNKKVDVQASSTASTVALDALKSEYELLTNGNLTGTYTENSLVYTITLDNIEGEFIPLYSKGMTSFTVKDKEVFKKWECE